MSHVYVHVAHAHKLCINVSICDVPYQIGAHHPCAISVGQIRLLLQLSKVNKCLTDLTKQENATEVFYRSLFWGFFLKHFLLDTVSFFFF